MTIKEVITGAAGLPYKELCSALIERFGVKQPVKWDSVLPHEQQQALFGGAAADRYTIWFFGNKTADVLKIVISGKEGKKIRLKTLELEAGQWFKTYAYILGEVERKFNTGGLFQQFKEPVVNLLFVIGECR